MGLNRPLYLWEDGGRVVSLVGAGRRDAERHPHRAGVHAAGGSRSRLRDIAHRGGQRADQLERGRQFCFLFTDLANPTSNAIYQAIGYEPVCDMDQYRFDR